ncbi:MAG: Kelch repeat-containing protein [Myxococcaceae bacterium]
MSLFRRVALLALWCTALAACSAPRLPPALEHALSDPSLRLTLARAGAFEPQREEVVLVPHAALGFDAHLGKREPVVRVVRHGAGALRLRPVSGPLRLGRSSIHRGAAVYADEHSAVVLTPHESGVKEDIVLTRELGDALTFEWELELDPGLFARLDLAGRLEVRDRAKRLVYVLPAPVVHAARGNAEARFELDGTRLRLKARGLSGLSYPLTIDPSVVVTSSADFELAGNDEGNVDITATALVRAKTRIGAGAWTATSSFTTARERHAAVTFNGFVYVVGGSNPTFLNDVQYAALNNNGTAGAFATTSSFATARAGHASVAYNGYLYVLGGTNGTYLSDVQVAPILASGALGPFVSTSALPSGRAGHRSVAHNGYLYVIGGFDGTSRLPDVLVARINADGTLGAWVTTTALPIGRELHAAVAQDGFLYVLGGYSGSARLRDVQVARLNTDGTAGAWTASSQFTTARQGHAAVFANGHLYLLGGFDGAARYNDVQVAPVLTGGGLDAWDTATAVLTTARENLAAVAYKGHLFALGGYNGTARLNDVRAAPLDASGQVSSAWTSTTSYPTAVFRHTAVSYNGYLYSVGGIGALRGVNIAQVRADGTLGLWTAAPSLPADRAGASAVAFNNFLYVTGGEESGEARNTVLSARINTNGTLGAWSTATSFTTTRKEHKSLVANGYLYVLGGQNSVGALNSVEYAPLNADGTLGAFATTTSFNTPRSCFVSVTHNGFVYVGGGFTGPNCFTNAADTNNVQYAPLNANGTLGPWNNTTPLPRSLNSLAAAVHNGYLYTAGGYDETASTAVADVNAVAFNADGSLGTWRALTPLPAALQWPMLVPQNGFLYQIAGAPTGGGSGTSAVRMIAINDGAAGTPGTWVAATTLPVVRSLHASVAHGGYLYVLGGRNGGGPLNDVWSAPLGSSGATGAWSGTTPFSIPRSGHTSVVCNGYLYVLGGFDGTVRRSDVQYAAIGANGTVGAWAPTTAFATGRERHASVCWNNRLYVLGGHDGTSRRADVQSATVNPNGTVGPWSVTTSLPAAVERHASAVNDGYLYVVGGFDGARRLSDVLVADINADGTLAPFAHKPDLNVAREGAASVAHGGFLYVLGGANGALLSSVEVAPLLSNGGLGSWSFAGGFTTARSGHAAVSFEGNLYVLGGDSGGASLSDVQYAALRTPGQRGVYSKLIDLGSLVTVDSLVINGSATRHGTVSVEYRTAPASALLGATVRPGAVTLGNAVAIDQTARYLWVRLTLDDSLAAVNNLDGTSERDVTDLTVVYTPPASRLVFVTPSRTFAAGQCGGAAQAITVQLQDASGTAASAGTGGIGLTVSSDSTGTAAFYTDSGCTTVAAGGALTLPAGQSTLTIYYADTRAGAPMLSIANAAGLANPTPQQHTVSPGSAAAVLLSGVPNFIQTGTPSAATVEVRDAFGNRASGFSGTLRFTSSDPLAVLAPDVSFTPANGGILTVSNAVTFGSAGLHTLTATTTSAPPISGEQTGIEVRGTRGTGCQKGADCGSGICAQGICCEQACTGACQSCALPSSRGTCAPVPNGTSCANGTYCDGQETCSAGICAAGTPVVCTDPQGERALSCSEATRTCADDPTALPVLERSAFLTAGVDVPYRYNARGRVRATGARPMTFERCDATTADFFVEPASGGVFWTPTSAGDYPLCVSATNAVGADFYRFTVNVRPVQGADPTAFFTLTPEAGAAPLELQGDPSGSTADPSTSLMGYAWSFGDGSHSAARTPRTVYPRPGSYQVQLTVFDGYGRTASTRRTVPVTSPAGQRPPLVRLSASALSGDDELTVDFTCDCQPGDAPITRYLWTWDETPVETATSTLRHAFGPGRHRVQLLAQDGNGQSGVDTVELVVTKGGRPPPLCKLEINPASGVAPLTAYVVSSFVSPSGTATSHQLSFSSDGLTSAAASVTRTYPTPVHDTATLSVVDAEGLTCRDAAEIVALGPNGEEPPRILLPASDTASCYRRYEYAPRLLGGEPVRWTLAMADGSAVPEALSIDSASGRLTWRDPRDTGELAVVLRAENAAGAAEAPLTLGAECLGRPHVFTGCGCGELGGRTEWLLGLLAAHVALTLRTRRRRAREHFEAE